MSDLDTLLSTIQQTSKYRDLSPDLIRQVGTRELAARRNLREAIKATKNKLHQVGGAYFPGTVNYAHAAHLLETLPLAEASRQIMRLHSSTNERLPIVETFFSTTLANLPTPHAVLDLACGLNPLALPWMPFPKTVQYTAYDIYADLLGFVEQFMQAGGWGNGRCAQRDLTSQPPTEPADLVFLLKTLPCLEQIDKTAAKRLLDSLQTRHILISYPAQSLGGRAKGMVSHYEAHFTALAEGRGWDVQRFEFATELAFLVQTNQPL